MGVANNTTDIATGVGPTVPPSLALRLILERAGDQLQRDAKQDENTTARGCKLSISCLEADRGRNGAVTAS